MKEADYFDSHLPRCLDPFFAQPTRISDIAFDGHPSISELAPLAPPGVQIDAPEHFNPTFALHCACGSNNHLVHCYRWANPDFNNQVVTLGPLLLECAKCRKTSSLSDQNLHGYNAELGLLSSKFRTSGDKAVYACPNCGREPLEVFAQFEFPDDLFDGDFAEFENREQELFTGLNLAGKCAQCSQVLDVASFDCT